MGKDADFVVLSQDIMTLESNPDSIKSTVVLQTVLEGQEIYRDSSYTEKIVT